MYMGALLLVFVLAECAYVSVDTWLSVWAADSLERDADWCGRVPARTVGCRTLHTSSTLSGACCPHARMRHTFARARCAGAPRAVWAAVG